MRKTILAQKTALTDLIVKAVSVVMRGEKQRLQSIIKEVLKLILTIIGLADTTNQEKEQKNLIKEKLNERDNFHN